MKDSMALTRPSLSSGSGLREAMYTTSSPSSDLNREELDLLRTALQTESTDFEFPRLFAKHTSPKTSHLAARCFKLIKKSPRRPLIPQDDWLKLIGDNRDLKIESQSETRSTTKLLNEKPIDHLNASQNSLPIQSQTTDIKPDSPSRSAAQPISFSKTSST